MIKLLLLPLIIFAVPSGIVTARLLWRYGNLKLKAMEQEQYDKYLK